ncbi:hypothetical protein A7M79_00590 [Acinetobacter baumannii]|uniref:hypothetical protein n=1 Tax=Acinetobacter baumannii TaxID=470 RepID=UPI0008DCB5F5|nr:hypothetical protein [Acinetobacter baumannii]OIH12021.1 hypothetical protein A7M79_00590 [Acinetobacter baumannii]
MKDTNKVEIFVPEEEKLTRIESVDEIKEGMYAVLKIELNQKSNSTFHELHVGDCLLIKKLQYAHDNLHNIAILDHPRNADDKNNFSSFSFLLDDFHEAFDLISREEGLKRRKLEMAKIEAEQKQIEDHLQDLNENPHKLASICLDIYSRRIESSNIKSDFSMPQGSVLSLLGSGNPVENVENYVAKLGMQKDLVEIKQKYLMEQQDRLIALSKKLQPYVMEHTLSVIATTEEQQEKFKDLNNSVASMKLFSGDQVEVFTIKEGKPAPDFMPVTMMQSKLLADEELAYFNPELARDMDVDNFSDRFIEILKETPELVKQIFPTERCVVVLAIRDSYIDYKDNYWNIVMNEANRQSFLLIRNGENIHLVYSPIGSHLAANNLFPSREMISNHFRDNNGEVNITIESLDYATTVEKTEKEMLHYKRFLMLLSGLQMRLNILGNFAKDCNPLSFFQLGFQKENFVYIHDQDGEGLFGDLKHKDLIDWVLEKNASLTKGSLLVTNNRAMTQHEIAGGCFRYSMYNNHKDNDGYSKIKQPVENYSIVEAVHGKNQSLVVKLKCSNQRFAYDEAKWRETNVVFTLIEGTNGISVCDRQVPYLVLNDISYEELEFYCSQRRFRKSYLKYAALFEMAKKHLKSDVLKARIDEVYDLLDTTGITHTQHLEARSMIQSLLFFMAGKLSKQRVAELVQYNLNKTESKSPVIKAICEQAKYVFADVGGALKLTVDNRGNFFVYTNMKDEEQINTFRPHIWVNRYAVSVTKGKNIQANFELVDKHITVEHYRRVEKNFIVFDQDKLDFYVQETPLLLQTKRYGSGYVSSVGMDEFTGFDVYENNLLTIDILKQAKPLLTNIVTNKVTRSDVAVLKSLITIKSSNWFEDSEVKYIPIPVGYLQIPTWGLREHEKVLAGVVIRNYERWLEDLELKLSVSDADIVDQDNSDLTFGFIKQDMRSLHQSIAVDQFKGRSNSDISLFNQRSKSAKSLNYIFGTLGAENRSDENKLTVIYSPFKNLLDLDNELGSAIPLKPEGQFYVIEANISIREKSRGGFDSSKLLHQAEYTIFAESGNIEYWEGLLTRYFNNMKSNYDLNKNTVYHNFKVGKTYVNFKDESDALINKNLLPDEEKVEFENGDFGSKGLLAIIKDYSE